ncbi:MAG: hypothetical protein ACM3ZQ_06680 [Bacillota bacterium]
MSSCHLGSPYPPRLKAVITSANYHYPFWISDDGQVLYNGYSPIFSQSLDDGNTWSLIRRFPYSVSAIRCTTDGELLVCLNDASGTVPGSVWKSEGYSVHLPQAASWRKVLELSNPLNFVINWWGISLYDNIVVIAEYGSKAPEVNARKAYISYDWGGTWTPIFDLGGTAGSHLHGICFDPYISRIWLANGDLTSGIHYSDDWGRTWATVDNQGSKIQVTSIIALEGCVLFGSDCHANGIFRIRRRSRFDPLVLEIAYRAETPGGLKTAAHLIYRKPEPYGPTYFALATGDVQEGSGVIVATRDGESFHEVFRDWKQYGKTMGCQACFETASGKIIALISDGRQNSWSRMVADAPKWL